MAVVDANRKAMLELDSIIGSSHDDKDKIQALFRQIERLERETMFATTEMKAILKDIK